MKVRARGEALGSVIKEWNADPTTNQQPASRIVKRISNASRIVICNRKKKKLRTGIEIVTTPSPLQKEFAL
jgi:hypothetical protein